MGLINGLLEKNLQRKDKLYEQNYCNSTTFNTKQLIDVEDIQDIVSKKEKSIKETKDFFANIKEAITKWLHE